MDRTVVVFVALGFALALVATSAAPVFQQSNSQPGTFNPGSGGGGDPAECVLNSEEFGDGTVTGCVESSFQNLNPIEILESVSRILNRISAITEGLGDRVDTALTGKISLDLSTGDIPFLSNQLSGFIDSLINWGNSLARGVPGISEQNINNPISEDRELAIVISLESVLPGWLAATLTAIPATLQAVGGILGILAEQTLQVVSVLQQILELPQRISGLIWEALVRPIDELRRAIVEGLDGFLSDPLEDTL